MSFPSNRPTPIQELIDDGVLLINDGYRAKNSELGNVGLPFARAGNINNGFQFEGVDRFPKENRNKLGVKVSQPGDVVFTSKGTVGRFAFVSRDTQEFVYSPQLCFWRSLDHSRLNPRWLYYWMNGREFFSQFKGVSSQSDMAEYVSLRDQRSMEITLADAKEQSSISNILGSLDDKIALNRKLNETLEGMARALFQSWFVDFDPVKAKLAAKRHGRDPEHACMAALSGKLRILPGKPRAERLDDQLPTADELDAAIAALDILTETQRQQLTQTATHFPDDFQSSELGLIPNGWRNVALYDTADFVNGAAFKSDDFTNEEGAIPIIKIAELKQGITDQTKFTRKEVKERHRIDNGDLLYSWSGSPGTSLEVFKWFGGRGWLNQHIFKINTADKKQGIFVWLLLKHLKQELIRIAENKQTTGLGHVTVADMKRIYIAYPDDACLRAFGELVEPLYERHSSNIVQANLLAELRDSLLPKLLSGELSVSAAEDTVEAAAAS